MQQRHLKIIIITLIISILFMILTFIGAGYVLINHSQVNAGYAVIPMCFCLAFASTSTALKKRKSNKF